MLDTWIQWMRVGHVTYEARIFLSQENMLKQAQNHRKQVVRRSDILGGR